LLQIVLADASGARNVKHFKNVLELIDLILTEGGLGTFFGHLLRWGSLTARRLLANDARDRANFDRKKSRVMGRIGPM
jgi:hypothetical protein